MLINALNQRYATVEDIFVNFVAPELLGYLTEDNDTYFLYTPYKNICPTKALIEKGITMHYTYYNMHKKFVKAYNNLTQAIKDGLKNYCVEALAIFSTENEAASYFNNERLTFSAVYNMTNNTLRLDSLRLFILACFNYINNTIIAEYDVFDNYMNIIASPDFVVDNSNYGTDSLLTLNIGFTKLTDTSLRNTMHISDINQFCIEDMITVYQKCVFKDNIDAVYNTYKFTGYKVVDNSEVHTDRSLCRLCDIVKIGLFDVTAYKNFTNEIYDYNQYAAFSTTNGYNIYPEKPYVFQIVSHYVNNNYALPFQITDVQVSTVSDDGLEFISALTSEAENVYININNTSDMISDLPYNKDDVSVEKPSTDNSNTDLSTGISVKPTFNRVTLTKYPQIMLPNNFGDSLIVTDTPVNNNINFIGGQKGTITLPTIDTSNKKKYTIILEAGGLDLGDKGVASYNDTLKTIDSIKYANSTLIINNIGIGLVPYIDNSPVPTYMNAKSNINPDKYTLFALCFVTPNTDIQKRTAIMRLTQNESYISKDLVISQWGSPLIINLKMVTPLSQYIIKSTQAKIENGSVVDGSVNTNGHLRWRFKLEPYEISDPIIDCTSTLWLYNSYGYNADLRVALIKDGGVYDTSIDVSNNVYQEIYNKDHLIPDIDVFFQSESKYINATNETLSNSFYIAYDKVSWDEITLKIYFNSYAVSIPSLLNRIIVQYGYEPAYVELDANNNKIYGISDSLSIVDEDLQKWYIDNSSNISTFIQNNANGNEAKTPTVNITWTYNGKSGTITNTIKNLHACYSDIIPENTGIIAEYITNVQISNWLNDKDSSVPEMSLTGAFNTENLELTIFSKRVNTFNWQEKSDYNYLKLVINANIIKDCK